MNDFENREKIEKYLDELSEEYKTLLFNALVEQSGSVEDLNISDLLRLDNDVKKRLRLDYTKYQKTQRVLFLAGISYIIFGACLYLGFEVRNLQYGREHLFSLLALLVGFMGLIFCILSFAFPTLAIPRSRKNAKTNNQAKPILEYKIITKWRDVEGLANDLAIDQETKSPRSAITYLVESNLIDKQEQAVLRTLLKLRNEVVHSSNLSYSYDEVVRIIKDSDIILKKLKRVLG